MNKPSRSPAQGPSRRGLVQLAAGAAVASVFPSSSSALGNRGSAGGPVMVGSPNALSGMKAVWPALVAGGAPLDAAIATVKVVERDPKDSSVGLGGLPNESGVVSLDAACMDGATHNSGSVAAIENIVHPSEVARLVMERTDHCMLVGRGAYEFARSHGHPHTELLTERSRAAWMRWRESMSDRDDRFAPPEPEAKGVDGEKQGWVRDPDAWAEGKLAWLDPAARDFPRHGTIHCSVLSAGGDVACTTTTSGLSFKIPGRIGDSPIIGAGLYCDQEVGSAGSTGRGEAAILSCGSATIVELLRQGMSPVEAGLEVLRRIARQAERASNWQAGLLNAQGQPGFNINFYVLAMDGRWGGVRMHGGGKFAVADVAGGPRLEPIVPLYS